MEKEFKIGTTVTLDRYNHIDDAERVEIVGYGEMPISKTLTYKMNVKGIIIESTGISIMESKFYVPVPKEERHPKLANKIPYETFFNN
jgi:D-hexose-6-phosphate mutarotase